MARRSKPLEEQLEMAQQKLTKAKEVAVRCENKIKDINNKMDDRICTDT